MRRERKRPLNAVIMRASQLDAARLDSELTAMLKEQFMNVFSLFQPVSSGMPVRKQTTGCTTCLSK